MIPWITLFFFLFAMFSPMLWLIMDDHRGRKTISFINEPPPARVTCHQALSWGGYGQTKFLSGKRVNPTITAPRDPDYGKNIQAARGYAAGGADINPDLTIGHRLFDYKAEATEAAVLDMVFNATNMANACVGSYVTIGAGGSGGQVLHSDGDNTIVNCYFSNDGPTGIRVIPRCTTITNCTFS